VIYYDAQGKILAAGAETPSQDDESDCEDDDGWDAVQPFKLEWYVAVSYGSFCPQAPLRFKLLLRPNNSYATNEEIPRVNLPPGKTLVTVFADFYTYLFERLRTFICETHASGDLIWDSVKNDIDFILSHPNDWAGAQQSVMKDAAIVAGLVSNDVDGRARINFVSEGEASFHYCISSGLLEEAIKVS
jgi:hypothetical protein